MTQKRIYSVLILAGCVPFIAAAIAPYFGVMQIPIIGNVERAVALYSLAIISFMAGTHWGISLVSCYESQPSHRSQVCPVRMMLFSNMFVLVPWLVFCVFGMGIGYYFSLALAFTLLVLSDYRLMNRNLIASHYYHLRLLATAIVVVSLVSLAFTSL